MVFMSTQEAALLLNVTARTVERQALGGLYTSKCVTGRGRGGRQLRIALESLPQAAQDKYHGIASPPKPTDTYLHLNDKQRAETAFKHSTVLKYKEFKATYARLDTMQAFLAQFNEGRDKPISERQLNHWEHKFDKYGSSGLVDGRGGHNRGKTDIPPEAWELFKHYWFNESRPSVESCMEIVADELGIELPTATTFRRQIDAQIPLMVQDRYRKGKKYFQDHYEPYNQRDYSQSYSNQMWIADHHMLDVLVLTPRGDVVRPWVSAWQDLHSRSIVGYALNYVDPNSDIVLDSFARACFQCGIPEKIKIDNGKDYKAYDLFNTEFPMSVCNEMQIAVSCALPYNAKAKPIERVFGTIEGKYCKHLPAYIGGKPELRPEAMKKPSKELADIAIPWEDFKLFVENMVKTYNTSVHSSLGGRTPQEVYHSGFAHPMRVVVGQEVLNMFLMRTSKLLKVGRNGVRVPYIGHYYQSDEMFTLAGESVYVRYNADDVRQVYIFSENNNFLCIAKCVELCQYDTPRAMEQIRELQHKKKQQRKALNAHLPVVDAQGVAAYVERKAARFVDLPQQPDSTILLNPIKHQHADAIEKAVEAAKPAESRKAQGKPKRDFQEAYFNHMSQGG